MVPGQVDASQPTSSTFSPCTSFARTQAGVDFRVSPPPHAPPSPSCRMLNHPSIPEEGILGTGEGPLQLPTTLSWKRWPSLVQLEELGSNPASYVGLDSYIQLLYLSQNGCASGCNSCVRIK